MKPEYTFVAEADDKITGAVYAVYEPIITSKREEIPAFYMCGICTVEEYRGKGVAGNLIKKCIEFAKNNGIKLCYLIPATEELFKFYHKLGFVTKTYIRKENVFPVKNDVSCCREGFDKELFDMYEKYQHSFKPKRTEKEFKYICDCYSKVLRADNGYIVLDEDDKRVYMLESTLQNGVNIASQYAAEKGKNLITITPSDDSGTPFSVIYLIDNSVKLDDFGYINLMLN